MISENFYDTCTVISELQSHCPHSHLLYWEDWPRILLKNGKQVWNKVNFQFHSVFEWSNLLVWLNFLTIFTRLIQRNDISCALREASICSKYIYKTETDPCIVTGLHCLSYLNIWDELVFLHCSQLRPSCKMFTPRVLYWWNSVSLNGSLALISTMSFSEDSLCLCRCFFSLWWVLPWVFWVAWRELSIKLIDIETAFAPCLCVGSFPSVHSCVPLCPCSPWH